MMVIPCKMPYSRECFSINLARQESRSVDEYGYEQFQGGYIIATSAVED